MMINFSTNSFNPLANLKVSVRNIDGKSVNSAQSVNSSKDINSNSNVINSTSNNSINSSQNSNNKVLGYEVDKDGYFTAEFNEKAGIPKDFKIHSSSMQQMIEQATSYKPFGIPLRTNIDIAQSIGNAYKVFSQLTNESAKSAFSADEVQNLPFIYQYNTSTLEVGKTLSFDKAKSDSAINSLLAEQSGVMQTRNIFLDGFFDDEIGVIRNKNEMAKYTNENGEINTGGLLVALVNANATLIESETTIMGKMLGADRHTDASALNKWFRQSELQNVIVFGDKDFMQLLEGTDLDEFKTQYKAYQNKKMQERASEKSAVGFDDGLEKARKQLEMLFEKHFDNQKEVKKAVETQDTKPTQQATSDKALQDDFSWKFGTPWESVSDEELAKINTRLNNSFKVLADEYNKAAKDIVEVENSIEQQLVSGRLDKKGLDKFIDENPLPLLANSLIDKDLMSVYKTSASLDEFKAKWLELKNERTARLAKMFLQMGFEIEKGDLALSNFDFADTKFAHQIDIKA